MFRFVAPLTVLLTAIALWASPVAIAEEYQEGVHYTRITPAVQVSADDDTVVVSEFFWYGCGHCYNFEPMLKAWAAKLPEGAVLEPTPAMWGGPMRLHAALYYTAKALDVLDKVHLPAFENINTKKNRLASKAAIRDFFASYGVDPEQFDKAFDSFGIKSQVNRADSFARSAKVKGTPSLVVNGKYLVETRGAGGQAGMLAVADYLIQKELAAKAAKVASTD